MDTRLRHFLLTLELTVLMLLMSAPRQQSLALPSSSPDSQNIISLFGGDEQIGAIDIAACLQENADLRSYWNGIFSAASTMLSDRYGEPIALKLAVVENLNSNLPFPLSHHRDLMVISAQTVAGNTAVLPFDGSLNGLLPQTASVGDSQKLTSEILGLLQSGDVRVFNNSSGWDRDPKTGSSHQVNPFTPDAETARALIMALQQQGVVFSHGASNSGLSGTANMGGTRQGANSEIVSSFAGNAGDPISWLFPAPYNPSSDGAVTTAQDGSKVPIPLWQALNLPKDSPDACTLMDGTSPASAINAGLWARELSLFKGVPPHVLQALHFLNADTGNIPWYYIRPNDANLPFDAFAWGAGIRRHDLEATMLQSWLERGINPAAIPLVNLQAERTLPLGGEGEPDTAVEERIYVNQYGNATRLRGTIVPIGPLLMPVEADATTNTIHPITDPEILASITAPNGTISINPQTLALDWDITPTNPDDLMNIQIFIISANGELTLVKPWSSGNWNDRTHIFGQSRTAALFGESSENISLFIASRNGQPLDGTIQLRVTAMGSPLHLTPYGEELASDGYAASHAASTPSIPYVSPADFTLRFNRSFNMTLDYLRAAYANQETLGIHVDEQAISDYETLVLDVLKPFLENGYSSMDEEQLGILRRAPQITQAAIRETDRIYAAINGTENEDTLYNNLSEDTLNFANANYRSREAFVGALDYGNDYATYALILMQLTLDEGRTYFSSLEQALRDAGRDMDADAVRDGALNLYLFSTQAPGVLGMLDPAIAGPIEDWYKYTGIPSDEWQTYVQAAPEDAQAGILPVRFMTLNPEAIGSLQEVLFNLSLESDPELTAAVISGLEPSARLKGGNTASLNGQLAELYAMIGNATGIYSSQDVEHATAIHVRA